MINKEKYKIAIKNTFLGFILADALGVPVEFSSRSQLGKNPVKDMIGYGTYNMPEGSWSDDSSMTLITLDVLSKYGLNYEKLMSDFIKWYKEGYMTPTDRLFDIGISTSDALNKKILGFNALDCGGKSTYSNGNGSLMRIYPFVFYTMNLSKEERKKVIFDASSLTHAHDISKYGCLILCEYLIKLLNGNDKYDAYYEICNEFKETAPDVYDRLLNKDIYKLNSTSIKSSGYIVDTLEAVIYSFLKYDNYKDIVLFAINLGEDTDTIGAIVGGLAGMYYKDIPIEWINKLKKLDMILKIIEDFSNSI